MYFGVAILIYNCDPYLEWFHISVLCFTKFLHINIKIGSQNQLFK